MVTTARKLTVCNGLQAFVAGGGFPLSRAHSWRFFSPSGYADYFVPFSKVVTSARSPNPLGIFRAISQFCSVRRETPKCLDASSCVNLRLSR